MNNNITESEALVLKFVKENTESDIGHGYVKEEFASKFEPLGYLQLNREMANDVTGIPARLTEEGLKALEDYYAPVKQQVDEVGAPWTAEEEVVEQTIDTSEVEIDNSGENIKSESITTPVITSTNAERYSDDAYAIDKDVPMPAVQRRNRSSKKYPFKSLNVGESFHVPLTEDMPKPEKTLSSLVSSRNKQHKNEGSETKFSVRRVDDNDKRGAGARVFRVS